MGLAPTGAIAAGGTLGILIPPSIIMVIYGMLAEQSIGKLFLAGFLPGLLQAILYAGTIFLICRRNPQLGPAAPSANLKEKVVALKASGRFPSVLYWSWGNLCPVYLVLLKPAPSELLALWYWLLEPGD